MTEKTKKILDIVTRCAVWVVVAFAVFMMIFTIVTVSTVGKNERVVFGYRFYIVLSDSMSESENNKDMDVHFNAGDIVIIKNVEDKTSLKEGDIISFISANTDSYGQTITHMIHAVHRNSAGEVVEYETFGTNTGAIDETCVEPDYVLGVYAGKLPYLGSFFQYTKTVPGYILCILVPFVLLILYNGVNCIKLFRQYKREQNEALQRERDEIAAERRRNEELLAQLQALGVQLPTTPPQTPPDTDGENS